MTTTDPRLDAFARLLQIVDRLRDPGGCPWDRDQTLASVAPSLLEETHEVIEALLDGDLASAAKELGDVLMNVLLLARIAQDRGAFSLVEVCAEIADKLVRRHPHVFGDRKVEGVAEVLANWEAIKQRERQASAEDASALAGIPKALPALAKSARMVQKAGSAGFQWPSTREAFAKLKEEVGELEGALAAVDPAAIEDELGDVLFAAAALAHKTGRNPETALQRAAARFEARFRRLERDLGQPLKGTPIDGLLAGWSRAKDSLDVEAMPELAAAPAEWRAALRALERSRRSLLDAVTDLPGDLLARAPDPSVATWTLTDVMAHLIDVDGFVAGVAAKFASRARAENAPPWPAGGLKDDPPRRAMTPPQGKIAGPEPRPESRSLGRDALLAELARTRAALIAAFVPLFRWHPRGLTADHPVFGAIDALQWLEFVAMHELRHVRQIGRIRAALAG